VVVLGVELEGMRMMRLIVVCLLIGLVAVLSGCATHNYWTDRLHDAADMVTLTGGVGAGAKGRVGPLHAGLLWNVGCVGLRGGSFETDLDVGHHVMGLRDRDYLVWAEESFQGGGGDTWPNLVDRRKHFDARGYPLLSLVHETNIDGDREFTSHPFYYYTQVEAVVGLVLTVRVGANPGEMVDFILGWTTLDIFDDDLARRWRDREE
jgi:hypothetical protein